ncbi:MAG: adenylate kinase [Anaerolineae bacterium]|nr:adenylate kinase [Anaerolineae bacterium]
MQRIAVIGTTGSGKTTTAARLATCLGCPHVELDALHWEPGWQEAPLDVFRARVTAALAGDRWVVDGNYSKVRACIWPRADTIVWLDYPFHTVLRQLLWRTLRRVTTRQRLWGTNVETLNALVGRDSLILWMFRTYRRRQREYPALFARPENAHLTVFRLRSPAQADAWIATLNPTDTA